MTGTDTAPGVPGLADRPSVKRPGATLRAARPAFLYGLRLWASVCLALYIAFWLELDEPYWAATSALIACLPQMGASLRRGWYRVLGTLLGVAMSLLVAALFPQDRIAFLLVLALWGAASAFATTILRNFAAYGAALSGYTVAVIAGGSLGASGGVHAELVFPLAMARASEIVIGIVCTGIVRTLTDTGNAPQRLATLIAGLSAEIARGFGTTLAPAPAGARDMTPLRRALLKRVIALDPVIDQALGESSWLRYHAAALQRALDGLFCALVGWRAVERHLASLAPDQARDRACTVLRCLAPDRNLRVGLADPARWLADPKGLRRTCDAAMQRLADLQADTASLRLLADKTAELLAGISHALGGLALLVEPGRPKRVRGTTSLRVPDLLPALVNAGRAFATIGAAALLWVATGWPNGVTALTFAMVIVIAQGPQAAGAYANSLAFSVGAAGASMVAIIVTFAVLPALPTHFAALSLVLGLCLVPLAALTMLVAHPGRATLLGTMMTLIVPFLAPTNPMRFDGAAHLNQMLAILAGCMLGAASFRLIPPPAPRLLVGRLLRLTRDDLNRLALGKPHGDWSGRILGRLVAMPVAATPLERARLVAALSAGHEIVQLRQIARRLGLDRGLATALAALPRNDSAGAVACLELLDLALGERAATQTVLRARGGILVLSAALTEHAAYVDAATPA